MNKSNTITDPAFCFHKIFTGPRMENTNISQQSSLKNKELTGQDTTEEGATGERILFRVLFVMSVAEY